LVLLQYLNLMTSSKTSIFAGGGAPTFLHLQSHFRVSSVALCPPEIFNKQKGPEPDDPDPLPPTYDFKLDCQASSPMALPPPTAIMANTVFPPLILLIPNSCT